MSSPPRKKRVNSGFVSNPFVKKRNLEWSISPPRPLQNADRGPSEAEGPRTGAHPPTQLADEQSSAGRCLQDDPQKPRDGLSASAAIENNTVKVTDHLDWFSSLLTKATLQPFPEGQPRLAIPAYRSLYNNSFQSSAGAHFVVTQHDHPVAGPHYDLRLQINKDSSCSWAVMYGLPGDPNSRGRTGRATGAGVLRYAIETRVHCLWNHLIETAGSHTGSLLVWDTGSYEVLPPRQTDHAPADSQEGSSDAGEEEDGWAKLTQQEKLAAAFSSRKIRLRLNGSRLPRGYAVNMRLTKDEDAAGRAKAARPAGTRKKRGGKAPPKKAPEASSESDGSGPDTRPDREDGEEEEFNDDSTAAGKHVEGISGAERELRELENAETRRTNAYSGAVNSIGSVYQRQWFLSIDREECGFVRTKKDGRVWWQRQRQRRGEPSVEDEQENDQVKGRLQWPFYVRGPDHERSIVTGRLGADILRDEGVIGFVRRKGWRPILG
ncbi:hypothetical protein KVR01_006791 [Diaporthe batatas]|uniref:uncharacterized protein n=1 Tax=Diaporthe batatas TaxID=748121 RepID=UPI001D0490CD|nr:uncharacterized protein KVR01_006791 [Diaporthe batatas]KAG8163494.1 hypothetical protein KVR01_006791 [Diaporthe batatas]